jgi:hypothetical protein
LLQKYAPIAQPVEQLPFKQKVPGSNPGGRTINLCRGSSVVEQKTENLCVVSSILTPGTIKLEVIFNSQFFIFKKILTSIFNINIIFTIL